jgi:hypothetical protein
MGVTIIWRLVMFSNIPRSHVFYVIYCVEGENVSAITSANADSIADDVVMFSSDEEIEILETNIQYV